MPDLISIRAYYVSRLILTRFMPHERYASIKKVNDLICSILETSRYKRMYTASNLYFARKSAEKNVIQTIKKGERILWSSALFPKNFQAKERLFVVYKEWRNKTSWPTLTRSQHYDQFKMISQNVLFIISLVISINIPLRACTINDRRIMDGNEINLFSVSIMIIASIYIYLIRRFSV